MVVSENLEHVAWKRENDKPAHYHQQTNTLAYLHTSTLKMASGLPHLIANGSLFIFLFAQAAWPRIGAETGKQN